MRHDFSQFSLSDTVECSGILRAIGKDARSMEEVAGRIVAQLDRWFRDPGTGETGLVLTRLFKTHPYRDLPEDLRGVVRDKMGPDEPTPDVRCLTLLGTTGVLPAWQSRRRSERHRAIPLPGVEALARFPMIMQLVRQFGVEPAAILRDPAPLLVDWGQRTFNVFHVPEAVGSPFIPDQEHFVVPFGVRSVLGFGGVLPGHDLFAVILFSRMPIPRRTAGLFRPLALCVKLALLPFAGGPVFDDEPRPPGEIAAPLEAQLEARSSQVAALEQLLEVAEPTIHEQSVQLEEALAEARNLLESAADAIVIADGRGRIVRLNQQAERMFGYSREALVDQPVEMLIPERLRPRHVLLREAYAAHPESRRPLVNLEVPTRHSSGREIPTELTLSPLETVGGLLLIVILRDTTERKRMEEHLRRQNALLEQTARSERDAHDARKRLESQLVQTENLAALGRMVAGVAHEVNNPLAFVRNNLAVLQRDLGSLRSLVGLYQEADGLLGESRPELLGRIRSLVEQMDLGFILANLDGLTSRTGEGLRRIEQIVRDLRDFARLDEADLQEVDLNQCLATTVAIARSAAQRGQIEIETDLGPLAPIACYPAKLNQVFLNLLVNAIDASSPGGAVTIRTRMEPGQGVRLEIVDRGKGIDPSIRDRIFEPFFTTKPVGQGTGLGLSIVYGIVQSHGGRIDFDSVPGQGTRFVVHLPLVPPPNLRHNPRGLPGDFLAPGPADRPSAG